ncbi:MAG: tRNA (N6-threonylcarbamoyladenosine(37)-N6)-methyltransferase TrmO [Nanobdellota archaeon]
MQFEKIGVVRNEMDKKMDPFEMKKNESKIVIDEKFSDGLYRIEENDHINVFFLFDRSLGHKLKSKTYDGEVRGVFSSRSPNRPNLLGMTVVRLLSRKNNELTVLGLDALNGTPVVDIKPFVPDFDTSEIGHIREEKEKNSPRSDIVGLIRKNDSESLLKLSGKLHGHFCPGLSMGVIAGVYTMQKMSFSNDGMENLIGITETNNCMGDGIQIVTGCTFGNNSLVFKDIGKNAFTLVKRDGKGIRLVAKDDFMSEMGGSDEFSELFDKVVKRREGSEEDILRFKRASKRLSFEMIKKSAEEIFDIEAVSVEVPEFAPIHESLKCRRCGEKTMASRVEEGICLNCKDSYFELDGCGIKKK